jgi:diadenosine tetraphosphatase ApaH/serine/threonine PP2A family protein phosphatase
MKLALLSDIHSNIQAFNACMADAKSKGVNKYVFLGDFVGYGGDPGAVVDAVQAMVAKGSIAVKGNHDEMAVNVPVESKTLGSSSAQWTHDTLTPEHRTFLDQLPMTASLGECLFVHASAYDPEDWHYVSDALAAADCLDNAFITSEEGDQMVMSPATWVFCGHVHHHTLYYEGRNGDIMAFAPTAGVAMPVGGHRRWVATVGSVGQPRDGNPLAMYSIFDTTKQTLTFCRVPYDSQQAAEAIRRAKLPAFFAERLEVGR